MLSINHCSYRSRRWNSVTAFDHSSSSAAHLTRLSLPPTVSFACSTIPPNIPCLHSSLLTLLCLGTLDPRFLSLFLPTVPSCDHSIRSSSALASNPCNLRLQSPMLFAHSMSPNTPSLHLGRRTPPHVGTRDLRRSRRFVCLQVSTLLCIDRSKRSSLALVSNLCKKTA